MKNFRNSFILSSLLFASFVFFASCKKKAGSVPDCGIQLFDGENYKDDYVTLDGSGSYSNLTDLPNTGENWDNEADALKTGTSATLTIWTQKNFQGDSVVFQPGNEEPSLNVGMRSLKITCN